MSDATLGIIVRAAGQLRQRATRAVSTARHYRLTGTDHRHLGTDHNRLTGTNHDRHRRHPSLPPQRQRPLTATTAPISNHHGAPSTTASAGTAHHHDGRISLTTATAAPFSAAPGSPTFLGL